MDLPDARPKRLVARCVLIAGIVLFTLLVGINSISEFEQSDDILLLDRASRQSVHEIFTTTFFTNLHVFYYRPLPVLLTKVLLTPSLSTVPYRTVQAATALFSAAMLLVYLRRRKVSEMGFGAALVLLASLPFLRAGITWWGDMTTLINIAVFLLTLNLLSRKQGAHWIIACVLTAIAVLSKELGLVIALLYLWHYFQRKQWGSLATIVAVVAGYFWLRFIALGSAVPYEEHVRYQSAFLVPYTDSDHIRAIFGDFPYPFYLYNVISSTTMLLFGQPFEGAFIADARHVYLTIVQTGCSLLMLPLVYKRKLTVPSVLAVAVAGSMLITYRYTNVRQIPLAAVVWIILIAQTADILWKADGKHAVPVRFALCVLIAGWMGYAGLVLADNYHYFTVEDTVYQRQATAPRPDLMPDPAFYNIVRARHLPKDGQ